MYCLQLTIIGGGKPPSTETGSIIIYLIRTNENHNHQELGFCEFPLLRSGHILTISGAFSAGICTSHLIDTAGSFTI